jgi:hypothetical protein
MVIGNDDTVLVQNPSGAGALLGHRLVEDIISSHFSINGDDLRFHFGCHVGDAW